MTGPHSDSESSGTRPISVAELLARNGTIGAPAVTRRRRRRRGDSDAVTVAELTAEIPVIRDRDHVEADNPARVAEAPPEPTEADAEAGEQPKGAYWSQPEPRWPTSAPRPQRAPGPERSEYPQPLRHDAAEEPGPSGAEGMSPDPVDVLDAEIRQAEAATEDSAYVRSYLRDSDSTLFGGHTLADELARRGGAEKTAADAQTPAPSGAGEAREIEEIDRADKARGVRGVRDRLAALWRGTVVVLQSVLAVALGAGLFVAFDQLWRWNSIVALVLSVLVILGLVVGVRVVRKTEDIASTLIAVAVGSLITLGPLVLSLQSG